MISYKHTLLIICVLGLLGLCGFVLLHQTQQDAAVAVPDVAQDEEIKLDVATTSLEESTSTDESAVSQVSQKESIPKDIHIMADGTLMAGDGTILKGARILSDGKIELASGIVVSPAFDLRTEASVVNQHVVIDIVGTDFAYDVKQIKVKKGDTVTINLKSNDGFHDWVLDEFDAATSRINEGDETTVTFVADTKGTFQYYCSVMNHRERGMIGYLTVE